MIRRPWQEETQSEAIIRRVEDPAREIAQLGTSRALPDPTASAPLTIVARNPPAGVGKGPCD